MHMLTMYDVYIPSELYRFLDIKTGLYYADERCEFFVTENGESFFLHMAGVSQGVEIPDNIKKKIIQDVKSNPRAILYLLNEGLQPLKDVLVAKIVPATARRIDTLLQDARGYMEKDNTILFFYDKGSLKMNLLSDKQETSFSIVKNILKTTDNDSIFSGTSTFYAYYDDGHIIKFTTVCTDETFTINSIAIETGMKYQPLYEKGEKIENIFAFHNTKKRGLFRKILLKK